jgi:hypothetical protein
MRRAEFRVIPPRNSVPATPRRRRPSISKEARTVAHGIFGVGVVRFVKQIDDGSYAAMVSFAGTERMVRVAPEYWLMPLDAIMRLIPHLPPPAIPKPKSKATETFGDSQEEIEHNAEEETGDEAHEMEIAA